MICFIEKVIFKIRQILKISYLKLKYGKKIKIGKNVSFRKGFNVRIEKEGFVQIGDNCFFNNDCSINCLKEIIIGKNNLFGENIKIYDHNHKFSKGILERENFSVNSITIGDNNWIGTNVVLLSKTKIGNNNVIGASMVINETIQDNMLVKKNKEEKVFEQIR